MFDTLSDRLEGVFKRLRGKGRLSSADVDAALREVRTALLEADITENPGGIGTYRAILNP